ncbi:hypothetical protein [Sphaerisporangium aureirubrum]|uniref:DUF222 domain-containing protein n=1 Tax=Sphaerisporangium aureirubrum TaxID=1544736 RepID=A0ABW1NJQ7_9ACTN
MPEKGMLMGGDLAALVGEVSPYVTAAVSAYGGAVLARAQDDAAEVTVGWGRRILQRIFGADPAPGETPEAVRDLAADPGNPDLQAVLRVRILKALDADAELAAEVRRMLAEAAASAARVSVTASGERAVAAHTISGAVSTGDDSTIHR